MKITEEQTVEEYKAEIIRLRERDLKQRSTIRSLTTNRDNLKAKHENKLRAVVRLKVDGHLEMTYNEIAARYFTSCSHIRNLSMLIGRE
jgi:hypothetical protein